MNGEFKTSFRDVTGKVSSTPLTPLTPATPIEEETEEEEITTETPIDEDGREVVVEDKEEVAKEDVDKPS